MSSPRSKPGRFLPWVVGAVTLAVVALVLVVVLDDDPQPPEAAAAQLEAVASNPGDFYGERVTIGGEVVEIRGETFAPFVVEGGGESLLVVPQVAGLAAEVDEGDVVVVSGLVREVPEYTGRELLGEVQLFREWEGRPSVAAQQLEIIG